jgi:1-acyl-sn-glycerol-3-phosphate acyltransferase
MKFPARVLLAAYDYAVFYLGLLEFCLISLSWSLLAGLLRMVLPRDLGCRVGRYGIMLCFRLFLGSLALSGRVKFDLGQLDALRGEKAIIIAPNHPSLWDAVMMASRLPNVACIMKAAIVNNVLLGGGARLARYIPNDAIRGMISMGIDELRRGNQVLLFPEGTRTVVPPVGTLKGSIGVIACRAGTPVQTILVDTDTPFLSKGWPPYRKPPMPLRYSVRLGRRFDPPASSAALVLQLQDYFNAALPIGPQPHPMPAHELRCLQASQKDYAK